MKRTVPGVVAFIIVCAWSAAAASSSFAAAPEFLKKGKAEAKGVTFTATSGTSKLFSTKDKTIITCLKDSATGEIQSPTTVTTIITYTECTAVNNEKQSECKVNSPGQTTGIIKTNFLAGTLGKITGRPKVGILYKGMANAVIVELEGTCLPATPTTLEGSVIGEVKPVGKLKKEGEVILTAPGEVQGITAFEGGEENFLKWFGVAAALEGTEKVTFSEEIEIS